MAVRSISTRLAIEGEAAYKSAITRINTELKSLKSNLKLVESEFDANAKSVEALSSKGEALNKLYEAQTRYVKELEDALQNAKDATDAYAKRKEELTKKIEENNKALEELRQTTADTADEQSKLEAENKALNDELQKNERYLEAAQKGVYNWQNQLNLAEADLNQLDRAIEENERNLKDAEAATDRAADATEEYADETQDSKEAVDSLNEALGAAGLLAALGAVTEALTACVKASAEFESGMAGVAKTTDMSDEELDAMAERFKEMATVIPATTNDLTGIAEAAGQLGISKENIVSFTQTMADLSVATNMTADEAATTLARFANITKMSQTDFDRLGATIVDLGNNFATTESEIADMAMRIAGAGATVGMSEADILGLAAALSSVGIEAEMGGSAISRVIVDMESATSSTNDLTQVLIDAGMSLRDLELMSANDSKGFKELAGSLGMTSTELQNLVNAGVDLEGFAEVAGVTADEFKEAFGEDAVNALQMFINGLAETDEASDSTIKMLEDMGITEIRLRDTLLRSANASTILNDAVAVGNQAWEENVALTKEASVRYETTESKVQLFKNSLSNLGIAIGDQLTPAFRDLLDTGTDVLGWLTDFIEDNEAVVPVLTGVTTALGVFAGAIGAYTLATKAATAITTAFNAVMDANPYFLVATAIGALVAGLVVMGSTLESTIPSVDELTETTRNLGATMEEIETAYQDTETEIEATSSLAQQYVDRLKELEDQGLTTADAQQEYANTVAALNYLYPELNAEIDENTGLLKDGIQSVQDYVDSWKRMAQEQAFLERINDLIAAQSDANYELYVNQAKRDEIVGQMKVTTDNLAAAEGELLDVQARLSELESRRGQLNEQEIDELIDLSARSQELTESIRGYHDELREGEQTQAAYDEAIEIGTAAVEEHESAVEEASNALVTYREEQAAVSEETGQYAEATTEAANAIKTELTDLANSYMEMHAKVTENLNSVMGRWTEMGEVAAVGVEELQSALESQIEYMESYTENLDSLLNRGIEGVDLLAASFSDGSTQSAAALAGLREASDEEIERLIETMMQVDSDKMGLSDKLTEIQGNFSEALEAMQEDANAVNFDGFREAVEEAFGEETAERLLEGVRGIPGKVAEEIEDQAEPLQEAFSSVALAGVAGIEAASAEFEGVGASAVQSVVTGVEDTGGELVGAVETLGDEVTDTATTAGTNAKDGFVDEFQNIDSETRGVLETLKTTVTTEMNTLPGEMQSVGGDMIDGLITGLNNRASSLYSTVRSIVEQAIEEARIASDSHSPSRKTMAVAEDMGDGLIVGIDRKRDSFGRSMRETVGNAMEEAKLAAKSFQAAQPVLDLAELAQSDARLERSLLALEAGRDTPDTPDQTMVVKIYIDKRQLAELVSPYVSEEISMQITDAMRGIG